MVWGLCQIIRCVVICLKNNTKCLIRYFFDKYLSFDLVPGLYELVTV